MIKVDELPEYALRSDGTTDVRSPGHAEQLHPAARASPKAASGVPRVSDERLPYAANVPVYH